MDGGTGDVNRLTAQSDAAKKEREAAEQERERRERAKMEEEARKRAEEVQKTREVWARQEEKGRELQRELMLLQEVKAKKTAEALEMAEAAHPREREASTIVTSVSHTMYANIAEKEEAKAEKFKRRKAEVMQGARTVWINGWMEYDTTT